MCKKQLHLQYLQMFKPFRKKITALNCYSFLIQLCFFGHGIKLALLLLECFMKVYDTHSLMFWSLILL